MFDTQKIAATYDQIALNFSATRVKLSPETKSLLHKLPASAKVLDLGAGNGVLLTALPEAIDYLGIDISRELLKEAAKNYPSQKFRLGDVTQEAVWQDLPRFDLITAFALFHHLPTQTDQAFVLKQIRAHLTPGGYALLSVWRLDQAKFDRFRAGNHLSIPFHSGAARDFTLVTAEGLKSLAEKIGFTVESKLTKDNYYFVLKRNG